MKAKFPLRSYLPIGTALVVALLSSSAQAVVIFQDTYNYTTGSPAPQDSLATNQAARQTGGTTSSGYTEQQAGAGTRNASLTVINGASQLRLQTTNTAASPSQMAADLTTNFASSLVGEHYKISLTDLAIVRGTAAILPSDVWFAISVGDSATSISGPNDATADVSALIGATGTTTKWEDGNNLGAQAATGVSMNYGFATRFALAELHIDETAATKIAWVYFEDMNGDSFTSASWTVEFDNSTNRFIELRGHQGATGTDGTDVSFYVNSMSITIVPEPSTALLGGLGVLCLLRRRR